MPAGMEKKFCAFTKKAAGMPKQIMTNIQKASAHDSGCVFFGCFSLHLSGCRK